MPASQDQAVIALNGRLTFTENGDFRQMLAGLEQSGAARVVLDLTALDFMDSTGMGMLLVARDLVAGRGGQVALRNAHGQVERMLELAKFDDFFVMETGLTEA
jgi:HptB-dependent secretion and biofilm anti anti-sigma factor